ncbi:MAG: hypothetical protein EAZ47_02900 [Bacteroidetes bacterium]|jgi:hypothetical protein|nr:MAG: hypothetical protein EAZ47_02900 [Bacteroidota bacterium]
MGTNYFKLVLLITATPILFGSSCNKDGSKPCRNAPYSFDVTSEFSPQKEIYTIGDTIFLTSSFPKILTNLISNQQVTYSNSLGVGSTISTSILDTINKQVKDGLDKFTIFDIVGISSQLQNQNIINAGKNILFLESFNTYELKIGFILRQKGLFMLGISDLGSQGLRGQNCTNASFNMTVTNSNKNLNLFQYALGYPADSMLAKNIYCFRVQ